MATIFNPRTGSRKYYDPAEKKRRPSRPFDWHFYYCLGVVVLWIEVIAALLTSPGMVIKHVKVVGNHLLQPSQIERSLQFRNGQNWLMWRPSVKENRLKCFAPVYDVSVSWGWVGNVIVRISERKPIASVIAPIIKPQGKQYQMYMMDPDGILFAKLVDPGGLPRIEIQIPMELYLGRNMFDGVSFNRTDLLNPVALYQTITDKTLKKRDIKRRIGQYISKDTRKLFDTKKGQPNGMDATVSLTNDLNKILQKGLITKEGIQSFTELPQNLRNDALLMLEGDERANLNRSIIEFALPRQFLTVRAPGDSMKAAIRTLTEVLPKYHFKVKSIIVDPCGQLCFNMETGMIVYLGDGTALDAKLRVLNEALQDRKVIENASSITVSHITDDLVKKGKIGYYWDPKTPSDPPHVP